MKMTWSLLAAMLLLSACSGEDDSMAAPQAILVGEYDNSAQYSSADDALRIAPKIGDKRPWIDLQHARFIPVSVPAIAGDVIALEWRKGGPDGEISRQRLWTFQSNKEPMAMAFYGFKVPVDITDSAVFKDLTLDDLIVYGDRCDLLVTGQDNGYRLEIPETCRITTQSGRDMILSAQIDIRPGEVRYKESGRLADGTPIFEVPGGRPYIFQALD